VFVCVNVSVCASVRMCARECVCVCVCRRGGSKHRHGLVIRV
jgi:hypothetical protein